MLRKPLCNLYFILSQKLFYFIIQKWHFNKPHVFYLKPYSILNRVINSFSNLQVLCVKLCEPSLYKNLEIILNLFGVLIQKFCLFCFDKKVRKVFIQNKNRNAVTGLRQPPS